MPELTEGTDPVQTRQLCLHHTNDHGKELAKITFGDEQLHVKLFEGSRELGEKVFDLFETFIVSSMSKSVSLSAFQQGFLAAVGGKDYIDNPYPYSSRRLGYYAEWVGGYKAFKEAMEKESEDKEIGDEEAQALADSL